KALPTDVNNEFDLTERELEVLLCLAEGLTYKRIAEKLFLAEGTIRNYVSQIYAKLDVSNRQQAVNKGKVAGMIH
ncbi:MAG: response regulator transcription factor, partial [Clostridia bacterium]